MSPTRSIWIFADDRTVKSFAFSEHIIIVPLKPAAVVSVDIVDISGRDLEIFNTVECNSIGSDVVLEPSIWNALVSVVPEKLHSRR